MVIFYHMHILSYQSLYIITIDHVLSTYAEVDVMVTISISPQHMIRMGVALTYPTI